MRDILRLKSVWLIGGALLVGAGVAAARALKVEIDFDPWGEDVLGY